MTRLKRAISWFVDSGVTPDILTSDTRYIRFVNANTVFAVVQIPILGLLITLDLGPQVRTNLLALGCLALGLC